MAVESLSSPHAWAASIPAATITQVHRSMKSQQANSEVQHALKSFIFIPSESVEGVSDRVTASASHKFPVQAEPHTAIRLVPRIAAYLSLALPTLYKVLSTRCNEK